jgi:hypothetical protein
MEALSLRDKGGGCDSVVPLFLRMLRPLTNMTSDFSAQFRPRYTWNDDVMRAA